MSWTFNGPPMFGFHATSAEMEEILGISTPAPKDEQLWPLLPQMEMPLKADVLRRAEALRTAAILMRNVTPAQGETKADHMVAVTIQLAKRLEAYLKTGE